MDKSEFKINEKVLAKWFDHRFYLAFIVKVSNRDDWYEVMFIDDKIVKWISVKDIKKYVNLCCTLCNIETATTHEPTLQCCKCSAVFHRGCYYSDGPGQKRCRISGSTFWKCSQCVILLSPSASSNKSPKSPLKYHPLPQISPPTSHSNKSTIRLIKTKYKKQYFSVKNEIKNIKKVQAILKPNSKKKNIISRPRKRIIAKNLQCKICLKWINRSAIKQLNMTPLLFCDRFYEFKCVKCNNGEVLFHRIHMTWEQLVIFVLFTLYSTSHTPYFDFYTDILPFIVENWRSLNCYHFNDTSFSGLEHSVAGVFNNTDIFKSGRQVKKKMTLFMNRKRGPPGPDLGQQKHRVTTRFKNVDDTTIFKRGRLTGDTWKTDHTLGMLLTPNKSFIHKVSETFKREYSLKHFLKILSLTKQTSHNSIVKQQPVRISGSVVKVMDQVCDERGSTFTRRVRGGVDSIAAETILIHTINNAPAIPPESVNQNYYGYTGTNDFFRLLLNGDLKNCRPESLFPAGDWGQSSPSNHTSVARVSSLSSATTSVATVIPGGEGQTVIEDNSSDESSLSGYSCRLRRRPTKRKLCEISDSTVARPSLRKFPSLDANGNEKLWQLNNNNKLSFKNITNKQHNMKIHKHNNRGRPRNAKTKNIVNNELLHQLSHCTIPPEYLKNSVSKYFNPTQRILSGDKYSVTGRRTNINGTVECLVVVWK